MALWSGKIDIMMYTDWSQQAINRCGGRMNNRIMSGPWLSRVLASVSLFVFLCSTSGCLLLVGAGAGAGTAAYFMGKLEDEINVSVEDAHEATIDALHGLGMPIVKDQGDRLSGKVESVTADDRTVWIYIDSLSNSRSKVSIRVGLTGDEIRSQQILQAIREAL